MPPVSVPYDARMTTQDAPVALVTGSTRGIGAAIAQRLERDGYEVVRHGRAKPDAPDDAAEGVLRADIAEKAQVKELLSAVQTRHGRLDVLVLNAARAPFKATKQLLERDLRQLVGVNLLGNVFLVQAALPMLRAHAGRVIFLSSLGSRYMSPRYPLGPMKAAMESMVRHWAEEFRPEGIRANAVCAGLVKTDAYKTLRRLWPGLDALPDDHFVTTQEVADVVAFLAGEQSRGINGQTLVTDRGLTNRVLRDPA